MDNNLVDEYGKIGTKTINALQDIQNTHISTTKNSPHYNSIKTSNTIDKIQQNAFIDAIFSRIETCVNNLHLSPQQIKVLNKNLGMKSSSDVFNKASLMHLLTYDHKMRGNLLK